MPADRPDLRPTDDPGSDAELIADLQAFGRTLAAATSDPIEPDRAIPAGLARRSGPRWGLVAALAAVALVVVGFAATLAGETVLSGPTDSTGDDPTATDATETPQPAEPADSSDVGASPGEPPPPAPTLDGISVLAADGAVAARLVVDEEIGPALTPGSFTVEIADDAPPGTDAFVEAVVVELLASVSGSIGGTGELLDVLAERRLAIHTTLDPDDQRSAAAAVAEIVPEGSDVGSIVITVENGTGAIRSLHDPIVGQPPWGRRSEIDGPRTPASLMKPIVLAALFDAGVAPNATVEGGAPCRFDDGFGGIWEVRGGAADPGPIPVTEATATSNDCAFARLGSVAGPDATVEMANRLGIVTLDGTAAVPAVALGSFPVTPIELVGAYATLADGGRLTTPHTIEWIVDGADEVRYRAAGDTEQAVPASVAAAASPPPIRGGPAAGSSARPSTQRPWSGWATPTAGSPSRSPAGRGRSSAAGPPPNCGGSTTRCSTPTSRSMPAGRQPRRNRAVPPPSS